MFRCVSVHARTLLLFSVCMHALSWCIQYLSVCSVFGQSRHAVLQRLNSVPFMCRQPVMSHCTSHCCIIRLYWALCTSTLHSRWNTYAPPASTVESLHLPPLWYGLLACSPAPSPCTLPLTHAVQLQSVESVRIGFVHAAADARRGNATTVPTAGDESLHLPLLHHRVILGVVNQHTSFSVPIESFQSALDLKDVSMCFCMCTYLAVVQCVCSRALLVHSIFAVCSVFG